MKRISVLLVSTLFITVFISGCNQKPGNSPLMGTTSSVVPPIIVDLMPSPSAESVVEAEPFNAERSYDNIQYQLSLGPRIPGSESHLAVQEWIVSELKQNGWEAEVYHSTVDSHDVYNIVGKFGSGIPSVVIGAHYDSRLYSDKDLDPTNWTTPTPGANDGASGVALLLELSRILPGQLSANGTDNSAQQVWLVFFDAEDNGNIPGWDWILGSRAFVSNLQNYPQAAVIVDMIGDNNLNIYQEGNSDQLLSSEIWDQAAQLGYRKYFIPIPKHNILDDHVPFLDAGIPAVDIIDIDYPYWHTTNDTGDKVSGESLKIVGDTLLAWLLNGSSYFKN